MDARVKSLREIVYNQLIEDIVYGRINPGEKLLELELAKKFQVSRTPIREALLQLEREGLIIHTRNRGAIVEKISLKQEEELFDIVSVLEENAAQKAVDGKITREDLSYLNRLQKEMGRLSKAKNYFRYLEKNEEFHAFFVQKCGNGTLHHLVSDLRKKIFRFMARGFTLPAHIDHYSASHEKIIKAISQRNPAKAGKLMGNHVLDAKKFIMSEQMRVEGNSVMS